MTALAASYSSRASIWDVGFALLFGVIGYAMRRTNFSAAAFIIAFVLTSSMEEAFRQSMIISDQGFFVFTSFSYQGKFSYAPIFLLIGAAVVISVLGLPIATEVPMSTKLRHSHHHRL